MPVLKLIQKRAKLIDEIFKLMEEVESKLKVLKLLK